MQKVCYRYMGQQEEEVSGRDQSQMGDRRKADGKVKRPGTQGRSQVQESMREGGQETGTAKMAESCSSV